MSDPPFTPTTDYDRRVLRGLELARSHGERAYVCVTELDQIIITWGRPTDRVCTVCTPGGVAVNLAPDADERLIPEEG